MRNWFKILLILTIFLGISIYVNFRPQNIPDPDSLYHIRHAWIYQTNGIFDSSFPWTQFSAIRTMGADLWYGFHILLIPLTYISELTIAIKIAAVFITFFVLASFYIALKNIDIKFSELWAIFFLFSSPVIITRMTMMRPHPLSLGLTALIFSFFYKGPAILVLIFSFLLSWMHSSIFWLPIIAVCILVLFQWLNNQVVSTRKLIAFLVGIATGLIARPHPVANLKLIYIQVVDLYISKNHELAQIIGAELKPPTWEGIYDQKWFLAVFIIALIYLGRHVYKNKKETLDVNNKIIMLSSLALTAFSILMYTTARRAVDQLGLFTIIFTGSVFSHFIFLKEKIKILRKRAIIVLLFFLVSSFSIYNVVNMESSHAYSPTKFKESALWLKENTKEKDTVFYLNWGYFPFLFFWNQSNYYINGMDPVFLLKYDKKLYWKLYNMAVNENDKKLYWKLDDIALSDMGGITCGYNPKQCGPETIETVPDVLRNDFHASYVFVQMNKEKILGYLEKDKENFEKVYENEKEGVIIFKLL
ncbi:MAG: hypothetical protein Q7S43_01975 [bacterium]|nr:hypothetical protein [bacterium]